MMEAEGALQWLWGPGNEEQARLELNVLRARLHPKEKSCQTPLLSRQIGQPVRDIFKPRILKPFFIIHLFNILQVPCGLNILTYYMVDILSKTRNDETQVMDDYYSNVLISGVRFVTILISSILMLRVGRRTLSMISGILSSLSALCLGIILSLSTTKFGSQIEANLTFALILIYAGSMSFGFFALPSVMIGETQPSHIRGFACGYIYTMNDLLLGGFLKIYPWMLTTLQIHGLFLLFGISCAVCTIFLYLFLPETQGLTLQQIEDYFLQPNIMWITRHRYQNERKETEDVDEEIISST
jgi:MFS family permease